MNTVCGLNGECPLRTCRPGSAWFRVPGSWLIVTLLHKPRLLSDNESSYITSALPEWLDDQQIGHVRGKPYHREAQGKIERWHQDLKNRILLNNYYLPGDLGQQIDAFVSHYNHQRYHLTCETSRPQMSTSGVT